MTEMTVEVRRKDETTLLAECRDIYERKICVPSYAVIRGYWEIGAKIIQYEAEGWVQRERGSGRIKRIAENLGVYYTSLYAAIKLAERFPTEGDLKRLLAEIAQRGIEPSWNFVRNNVLPKNAGMPREDATHELLSAGERAAQQVERVVEEIAKLEEEAKDDEREVLTNVREQLQMTIAEASSAMAAPKKRREASRDYISWIHDQPEFVCIATGTPVTEDGPKIDAAHVGTVGSGGSDMLIFPLLHEMHMELHRSPDWWGRYKVELAEWFYRLPRLHARFFSEQGGGA
ncbi:MAG: DUF968 domain-containing protein [Gammaproteobacteria bacterium]|nr:DUF968 domain-containing protein [Gammaproteobacteria bacterium]